MTSASSTSARSLFGSSNNLLSERVKLNINNMSSVIKQIHRSSKSHEMLNLTIKNMLLLESNIDRTEHNLNHLKNVSTNFNQQYGEIKKSVHLIEEVKEHVQTMQR